MRMSTDAIAQFDCVDDQCHDPHCGPFMSQYLDRGRSPPGVFRPVAIGILPGGRGAH